MEVYKFGGASVNSAEAIRNVENIVKTIPQTKVLAVFSAMGKTTNQLEALLDAAYFGKFSTDECLRTLITYHLKITEELFSDSSHPVFAGMKTIMFNLSQELREIKSLAYDCAYDRIVSFGEKLSTFLIASYLTKQGIANRLLDAQDLIISDSNYREANVLWDRTKDAVKKNLCPAFEEYDLLITQGFIASNGAHVLTLGREGSDYSAAIFAYCLDVKSITIWKDVCGVLNADPKYFKEAVQLPSISYKDATELAYYGASVIHPKTIKPLQNKSIPLYVRSFIDPNQVGTWVGNTENHSHYPSFILKKDQILLSIYPKDFSFIGEHNLSALFALFSACGIKINLMQNSALSFSICIDKDKGDYSALLEGLKDEYDMVYNDQLELITIRYYTQELINRMLEGRNVLLEQKSRNTIQFVVKL